MVASDYSILAADPMTTALAWVLTYSLHSTALLGGAWLLLRCYKGFSDSVRDGIWKLALVGGVVTATAQVGFGVRTFGGSLLQLSPEESVEREVAEPEQFPAPNLELEQELAEPKKAQPALEPRAPEEVHANETLGNPSVPVAFPFQLVQQSSKPTRTKKPKPSSRPRVRKDKLEPVRLRADSAASVKPETLRESTLPEREAPASTWTPAVETTTEPERAEPELVAATSSDESFEETLVPVGPTTVPASPWFLLPWVGGSVVGGLAIVLALVRLRRALLRRTPLSEGAVAETFADLLRRSGSKRRVRLSTSSDVAAPLTFGVWRPEICLPDRALTELDSEQQEAMLAHELAHAIRRDPMWQLISKTLVAAFFFQPLNRLARKRIVDLAEYLSDDWAVAHTGRELPLASCLTEVARWLVVGDRPLLAPGMADGSRLSSRVYRLLDNERTRSKRTASLGSRVVLATTGLIAFAGFVPGITAAPLQPESSTSNEFSSASESLAENEALPPNDSATAELQRHWKEFQEQADVVGDTRLEAPESSTTSVLLLTLQAALHSLDVEIDDLQVELESIREAIRGLDDVGDLDQSVTLIEEQIARLRNQREVLTRELPKLVRSLESDSQPSESSEFNFNPRKLNR